jgi:hypothetical protein
MNNIRNISLLCSLLSIVPAVADPILSEDETAFQLGFPQVIVDKLNKYIAGVEGHENYEAFGYKTIAYGNKFLCEEIGICPSFARIAEAMGPYFNISQAEFKSRMSCGNLVSLAKTLLKLNEEKIAFHIGSIVHMRVVLNYFLDLFDSGVIFSTGGYPSTCISATCWKRLIASKNDFPLYPDIEEYKDALGEIALVALKQKFGKTS